MQLGKRYIFVGTDGETFTGILVSLTAKTITCKHKSDKNYQNSLGKYGDDTYHIPCELIINTFLMEELIAGQRYIFHLSSLKTPINGRVLSEESAPLMMFPSSVRKCADEELHHVFISISGNYETVHCYDNNQGIISFPAYWIKDILSEQ